MWGSLRQIPPPIWISMYPFFVAWGIRILFIFCYKYHITRINSRCYSARYILVDRLIVGIYKYPPLLGIFLSSIIFCSRLLLINLYNINLHILSRPPHLGV